jgi:hypothetical protein
MSQKSKVGLCALFLCVGSLTACETVHTAPSRGGEDLKTATMMPVPGARSGEGAVLVVAEIAGAANETLTCRWRVVNQETSRSFFLTVKADEPNVFAHLDPGTYKTGRLGCGITKVWDVDSVFPEGFRIEAGRVSYLGKLIFQFNGAELQVVRKASRNESATAMQPAIDATGAAQMDLISGFTGQAIDRGVAGLGVNPGLASEPKDGFDVYAKGIEKPEMALVPLVSHLKTCAKAEGDAGQSGKLEYVALYKAGRFSEMKSREATGFTDRMRSCIERGMMTFHPVSKIDLVEIRVRY